VNIDPRHAPEITGHSRPVASRVDRAAGTPSEARPADRVEMSPEAQAFQRLRPRLEAAADGERTERLDRLRHLLAAGEYAVSAESLAASMLRDDDLARVVGLAPAR
jgi:flagellar biosynthesis anti-sigma factor FlgM